MLFDGGIRGQPSSADASEEVEFHFLQGLTMEKLDKIAMANPEMAKNLWKKFQQIITEKEKGKEVENDGHFTWKTINSNHMKTSKGKPISTQKKILRKRDVGKKKKRIKQVHRIAKRGKFGKQGNQVKSKRNRTKKGKEKTIFKKRKHHTKAKQAKKKQEKKREKKMKDQKSILQDGIKKTRIKEKEKQREKNDEKKKMKEREEESGSTCINKWAEYTNGLQIATNVLKQVML